MLVHIHTHALTHRTHQTYVLAIAFMIGVYIYIYILEGEKIVNLNK